MIPIKANRWKIVVGLGVLIFICIAFVLFKKEKHIEDKVSFGEYAIPRANVPELHFQPTKIDRIDSDGEVTISFISQALKNKRAFATIRSLTRPALQRLNEVMAERLQASHNSPQTIAHTALYQLRDEEDSNKSWLISAPQPPADLGNVVWYRGHCERLNEQVMNCTVLGMLGNLQYAVVIDATELPLFDALSEEVKATIKSWEQDDSKSTVLQFKG